MQDYVVWILGYRWDYILRRVGVNYPTGEQEGKTNMEQLWNDMSRLDQTNHMMAIVKLLDAAPRPKYWGKGQNIITIGDVIYSYDVPVAVFNQGAVWVPRFYSATTSRHINKVAARWRAPVVQMWK